MKIISWNVNGIRAVEGKGFTDWLLKSDADVICIQETKARPWQLSKPLLLPGCADDAFFSVPETEVGTNAPVQVSEEGAAYSSYWSSAKKAGYSGTAVFTRIKPDKAECLGCEEYDSEGRVTSLYFGKTVVISAYFPNSQREGIRLGYKLGFCEKMLSYCNSLVSQGYNIVLCGDYNIAHKPIDLANPKANEGNAGYLPEEREWMTQFLAAGYADTFRMFCQEPNQYTWWSYRARAREKNIGWRIDYHCVNESFSDCVKSSRILPDVPGSDHCPIELTIEN